MKTYHLLNDFGVYKQTLKANFNDNDRGKEHDEFVTLIAKRTQSYTIPELELLFSWLWTSHDDCVDQNSDDYSALEVYQSQQKIKRGQEALDRLHDIKKQQEVNNVPVETI